MTNNQYVSGRRRMKCTIATAWRANPHPPRKKRSDPMRLGNIARQSPLTPGEHSNGKIMDGEVFHASDPPLGLRYRRDAAKPTISDLRGRPGRAAAGPRFRH